MIRGTRAPLAPRSDSTTPQTPKTSGGWEFALSAHSRQRDLVGEGVIFRTTLIAGSWVQPAPWSLVASFDY